MECLSYFRVRDNIIFVNTNIYYKVLLVYYYVFEYKVAK